MLLTADQKCYLWLSAAEIAAGRLQELISQYGSVSEIWDAFGRKGGPMFMHSRDAIDDLLGKLERKNVHLLFQEDDEYPEMLRSIQDPPYLLYYAGRISCLQQPMIGVVGTRRASRYGLEMASIIARGLADAGVCVVSGLARGIDRAAHEAVLSVQGKTIGVLGSGINVPYPAEHTQLLREIAGGVGLILSEYPLDAEPIAFHFPHRNRIISGLSQGIVFVEGQIKSGGMHTVHAALMQGREVFAVPGQVGTAGAEGPHAILREGARIITSAADLLDDLGLAKPESSHKHSGASLNELQRRIVDALRVEPLHLQEIAEKTALQPDQLLTELGTLEILGTVAREVGNRFYLPMAARQ